MLFIACSALTVLLGILTLNLLLSATITLMTLRSLVLKLSTTLSLTATPVGLTLSRLVSRV